MGETTEERLAGELARLIEASGESETVQLRELRDVNLKQERLTLNRRSELQRAFEKQGLACSVPLLDAGLDEEIEVTLARSSLRQRLHRWVARPMIGGVRWVALLIGVIAAVVALYPLVRGPGDTEPMSGDINLAVASFVDEQSPSSGEGLGETLYRSLQASTRPSDHPGALDIQVRGPDDLDPVRGVKEAEKVLEENGAQIVIYGEVARRPGGTKVRPRLYVDPHLLSGAEELGGSMLLPAIDFGAGNAGEAIPGRSRFRTLVSKDLHAFSSFATGLGWFGASRWKRALNWFEISKEEWGDGEAAALSSLFVGNTEGKLGNLSVAHRAYLKALALEPVLDRAELGLAQIELYRALVGCSNPTGHEALKAAAAHFSRLHDKTAGTGLPRLAFQIRARLGEARANLCLGLDPGGAPGSAKAAELGFEEVLQRGAGIPSFYAELAEARAGRGLSALQTAPEDDQRSYLHAKAEYELARQLTNDPVRAREFMEVIELIDGRLEKSVWSRIDPLPAGVRTEIEYYGVGDSLCGPVIPPEPKILLDQRPFYQFETVPGAEKPEIGETLTICPRGFDTTKPLLLTVEGPGKFVRTANLPPVDDDRERHVAYWLDREWPAGAYAAVASQGDTKIRLGFPVSLPLHRGVRSPEGFAEPIAASSWPVMVIGQPANSKVTVDVYGDHHDPHSSMARHYTYATSFELVTDENGIAEIELPPRAGDEGVFFLKVRGHGSYVNQDLVTGISICDGGPC